MYADDTVIYSGAPAARRAAKQSTIIIETEPHVYMEIGTHATLFCGQHD